MSEISPLVYVIDDDDAVRESLTWLISSVDLDVEAYPSAIDFLDNCADIHAGCVVTDIRMPGISGLELQKELRNRKINIPIIVITGHGDVQTAVQAMKAGAFDFIEKPFNDQQLLDRVNLAVTHSLSSSEALTRKAKLSRRREKLTPRERQIMDLVVAGKANKTIAYQLDISEKTVEAHRAKVMNKMKVTSLAELVKIALVISRD